MQVLCWLPWGARHKCKLDLNWTDHDTLIENWTSSSPAQLKFHELLDGSCVHQVSSEFFNDLFFTSPIKISRIARQASSEFFNDMVYAEAYYWKVILHFSILGSVLEYSIENRLQKANEPAAQLPYYSIETLVLNAFSNIVLNSAKPYHQPPPTETYQNCQKKLHKNVIGKTLLPTPTHRNLQKLLEKTTQT